MSLFGENVTIESLAEDWKQVETIQKITYEKGGKLTQNGMILFDKEQEAISTMENLVKTLEEKEIKHDVKAFGDIFLPQDDGKLVRIIMGTSYMTMNEYNEAKKHNNTKLLSF